MSTKAVGGRGFQIEALPQSTQKTSSAAGRTWKTLDTVLLCIPIVGWIILAIRWFGNSEDLAEKVSKEATCASKPKTQDVARSSFSSNLYVQQPKKEVVNNPAPARPAAPSAQTVFAPSSGQDKAGVNKADKNQKKPDKAKKEAAALKAAEAKKATKAKKATGKENAAFASNGTQNKTSTSTARKYLTPEAAVKEFGVKEAATYQNFYFTDVIQGKIKVEDADNKKNLCKTWAETQRGRPEYDRATTSALNGLISTLI